MFPRGQIYANTSFLGVGFLHSRKSRTLLSNLLDVCWRRNPSLSPAFGEYACSRLYACTGKVIMLHMPSDDWANVDSLIISQKVLKN